MRFHQAYYGATPSGHDLLACDPTQRERFIAILDRTDLQGVVPAGVSAESYVTAFQTGTDFIIMRTSTDRSATRGGMMFSHVFLTSADEIGRLPSLAPILAALKVQRPEAMDVSDLECCEGDVEAFDIRPVPGVVALANALVSKEGKPGIWPDAAGDFLETMDLIWRGAWPELRQKLTFSMALSPDDLHLNDYSVVYIPAAESTRWTGYRVIAKGDATTQLRPAATAFVQSSSALSLRNIAGQICWPPTKLSDLEDFADIEARLDRSVTSPREEIRTLRLLCYLAPQPEQAATLKLLVIARVLEAFPHVSLEDLLACRNLPLECLSNAQPFWDSLRDRVDALLAAHIPDRASERYVDFLHKTEKEPLSPWRRAVEDGARSAWSSSLKDHVRNIWNWISLSPDLAGFLFPLFPENRDTEIALESGLRPTESDSSVAHILSALAKRDLPNLRAKCLATYLTVDAAFDWELSSEVKSSALSALCRLYPPNVIVAESVRTADACMIPLAKAAIENNGSLVLDADLDSQGWRLLLKSLQGTSVRFSKGSGFDRVQRQMLAIISSETPDYDLVKSLGSLGLFDLSELADQTTTWNAIPTRIMADVIEASLDGTILRLASGQLTFRQLVPQLQASINDQTKIFGVMQRMPTGSEHQQLRLFTILDVLREEEFRRWYSSFMSSGRSLSSDVALEIGNVISQRSWKLAAEHVVDDVLNYRRHDLIPGISRVKSLLGLRHRFRLMLAGISVSTQEFAPHDLWDYLESVLVERFPNGPREHALWSRAKGDDADLRTSVSGREQWHYALELVRDGAEGAPGLEKLISEARSIYSSDPSLNWLHKNWHNFAPRTKGG